MKNTYKSISVSPLRDVTTITKSTVVGRLSSPWLLAFEKKPPETFIYRRKPQEKKIKQRHQKYLKNDQRRRLKNLQKMFLREMKQHKIRNQNRKGKFFKFHAEKMLKEE
jgi:hypothetical protein